jgi:hypothetical protein
MENVLPPDFREFLQLLNAHEVEYLLIGGYAVGYYGYPRATNDIDLWIAIDAANAARVVRALRAFGFGTDDLSPSLFLQEKSITRLGRKPLQIEITTSISGVEFADCFVARNIVEIDGLAVNLISLRHLRINKQASGRPKDLADLDNLPERAGPTR